MPNRLTVTNFTLLTKIYYGNSFYVLILGVSRLLLLTGQRCSTCSRQNLSKIVQSSPAPYPAGAQSCDLSVPVLCTGTPADLMTPRHSPAPATAPTHHSVYHTETKRNQVYLAIAGRYCAAATKHLVDTSSQ